MTARRPDQERVRRDLPTESAGSAIIEGWLRRLFEMGCTRLSVG